MGVVSTANPWVFVSGLLGNASSFIVFVSPLPTFILICKTKSTMGFSSVPYLVGLFSAMGWIYYAFVTPGAFLLITINSFGCVVETIYLALYLTYATKQARIFTLRILLVGNFGGFCAVLLLTQFLSKGENRVNLVGWINVAFATSVFAAPLSVMRQVIRTKSVEFLSLPMSIVLTFSAIAWLMYGIFLKDLHVAIPNVLGFIFGLTQLILHAMYRKNKKAVVEEVKVPEHSIDVPTLSPARNSEVQEEMSSDQPEVHDHRVTGMGCRVQHDQREKALELPNPNPTPLVGTCGA